jgi:hypothetical protein
VNVVKVNIAKGTSTLLQSNPFTNNGGYLGGVDVWPHP